MGKEQLLGAAVVCVSEDCVTLDRYPFRLGFAKERPRVECASCGSPRSDARQGGESCFYCGSEW